MGTSKSLGPAIALFLVWCATALALPTQASEELGQPGVAKRELTQPTSVGAVEGEVTFHGEIPKSPIADDAGVRRDLLEVDGKTRGLRGVVANLLPADASDRQHAPLSASKPKRQSPIRRDSERPVSSPRAGPEAGAPSSADGAVRANKLGNPLPALSAGQPITVDQIDHGFAPRVVAVRAGQPVTFTNSDPANHNVRTSSPVTENVFNVFTGVGGKYQHRFVADPEMRPVQLGCDIHPWMRGWIYVFDHAYFAVTDEAGGFRIGSVPPGRYRLILRQPDIRYTSERHVTVTAEAAAKIEVEVRPSKTAKPDE